MDGFDYESRLQSQSNQWHDEHVSAQGLHEAYSNNR